MRHRLTPIVAAVVVLVAAATAPGIGYTDYLERLQFEYMRLVTQHGQIDQAKVRAVAESALEALKAPGTAASYLGEYKALAKVAAKSLKTFGADGELVAEYESVLAAYRADLVSGRNALAAADPLSRTLPKVDAALAKADALVPIASRLKGYGKVAKTLKTWLEFEPPAGHYTWVISGLSPMPVDESIDFDGDSTLDNGMKDVALFLAGQGFDLEAAIATRLAQDSRVTMLWMWGVDSLTDDPEVWFSFLNGIDNDKGPADNFSGAETFALARYLSDIDLLPRSRGPTGFDVNGDWFGICTGESVDFAGLEFALNRDLRVYSTMADGPVAGRLFFTASANNVALWLLDLGMPAGLEDDVRALVDIDSDFDLTLDSFTVGFDFTAVKAGVQ